MTTETDLLPLPVGEASSFGNYKVHDNEAMVAYARANIARAVAPLQAEIERDEALLRQALEALEFFRDTAICEADTAVATEAIVALRERLGERDD